jgi:hypothetical protein
LRASLFATYKMDKSQQCGTIKKPDESGAMAMADR